MFPLWRKLLEILLAMLCCGRKKETLEHGGTAGLPAGTKEQTPTTSGEQHPTEGIPAGPRTRRLPPGQYSRSYPESEAVAFGQHPIAPPSTGPSTGHGLPVQGREGGRRREDETIQVPERGLRHRRRDEATALLGRGPETGTGNGTGNGLIDMGIKSIETFVDYTIIEKVEIVKRPGQTLGFYIREGNGIDRTDGVFISRIAAGSAVEKNGLLRVGEEILAIDSVDVTNMSLDDVVILMSIPSRLLLTIRTRKSCCKNLSCPSLPMGDLDDEQETATKVFRTPMDIRMPTSVDEITRPFSGELLFPGSGLRRLQRSREPASEQPDGVDTKDLFPRISGRRRYRPDEGPFVRDSIRQRTPERHPEPEMTKRPITGRASFHETVGSWDRKTSGAAGGAGAPYSSRRSVRYHLDYSSDSDAQFLQMDPPREWIRAEVHPIPKKTTIEPVEFVEMKDLGRSRSKRKDKKPGLVPDLPSRDSSAKRYSSDSEVVTESSLLTGRQEAAYSMTSGLLKPGDKCNSLPEIENGSAKDELKHWLRKLDKLSFELQEFNNKISTSTQEAAKTTTPPRDIPTTLRTFEPQVPESYTSEEYRSWIFSRQSSLKSPQYRPKQPHQRRGHSISGTSAYQPEMVEMKLLKPSPDSITSRPMKMMMPTPPTSYYDPKQLIPSRPPYAPPKVIRPMEARGGDREGGAAVLSRTRSIDSHQAPTAQRDLPLTRKPLKIRPEEFRVHAAGGFVTPGAIPAKTSRTRAASFDGLLYIHIYCGHGLKTTRTTLRDLYCVVSVDGLNKARTAIRTGAINFDWDEDFEVELDGARRVSFSVYNWDPVAKQKLCFASSLTLEDFIVDGNQQRLALRLEPAGIIYVDLVYKDLSVRFQRKPSQEPRAIFGGDLQAVVARDGMEDGIPLVVRRCVEEIEKRGLESVGLYRLCGSARRQVQLEVELETDPGKIDLSSRSIPDISVLTGVLKDFFRQLTEPLLTNDLHQMLLDAMSVQIAEDPGGNAELMFSIIDCLPKENLNTLRFLVGHLKRVMRRREENKMTQLALGAIFGPLLLCPAYRLVKQSVDLPRQSEVVSYILDIWPDNT